MIVSFFGSNVEAQKKNEVGIQIYFKELRNIRKEFKKEYSGVLKKRIKSSIHFDDDKLSNVYKKLLLIIKIKKMGPDCVVFIVLKKGNRNVLFKERLLSVCSAEEIKKRIERFYLEEYQYSLAEFCTKQSAMLYVEKKMKKLKYLAEFCLMQKRHFPSGFKSKAKSIMKSKEFINAFHEVAFACGFTKEKGNCYSSKKTKKTIRKLKSMLIGIDLREYKTDERDLIRQLHDVRKKGDFYTPLEIERIIKKEKNNRIKQKMKMLYKSQTG